jgi:hypothetical protein
MMAWSMASRMVFASLVVAFVATVRPAVGAEPSPDARRPIVKSELRVIVRSAGYVDALRRQAGERPAPQPIARPLAGDLWLICVIDRPRQINMLTDRDLDTLGLSQDEAIALGTQNVGGGGGQGRGGGAKHRPREKGGCARSRQEERGAPSPPGKRSHYPTMAAQRDRLRHRTFL